VISQPEPAPGSPPQSAQAWRCQRRSTSRRPPRPMTIRPRRGWLWRASMVYQRTNGIEKDFGPVAEIHGIGINRNADLAVDSRCNTARERSCTGRALWRDARSRGIYQCLHARKGWRCGWARIKITAADLRVHEISNRLHTLATAHYHLEIRRHEISELVAVAIPALE
jgi:hypothetical protein